jgi:hypothetical protein
MARLPFYSFKVLPIYRFEKRHFVPFQIFNGVNTNHILKPAHGCGWNHVFTPDQKLDIIKTKLAYWNKKYKSDSNEPQYEHIEPRFYIEEKNRR